MSPLNRVPACALALTFGLLGCNTSSNDVILQSSAAGTDPLSLSVAWEQLEQRLVLLETDVQQARAETRQLCLDGAPAEHPICQQLADSDRQVAALTSTLDSLDTTVNTIESRVHVAEQTLSPIDYDARSKSVVFTGVNVQIRNGAGATDGDTDGTGNLIIGWNEADEDDGRTGSHNVIVGSHHDWVGHSGIAVGVDHDLLTDAGATVGGESNVVSAHGAVLIGGQDNEATGAGSVGIGGAENLLAGELSIATGGYRNDAEGAYSVILGGADQVADEEQVLLPTTLGPSGEAHPEYQE
jgi:hypothetical protein